MLGHNGAKTATRRFLEKFHWSDFYRVIVPYHAVNVLKVLRTDPNQVWLAEKHRHVENPMKKKKLTKQLFGI